MLFSDFFKANSNSGENGFSTYYVLHFYFKNMATVNLNKNRAVQPEFSLRKEGLKLKF